MTGSRALLAALLLALPLRFTMPGWLDPQHAPKGPDRSQMPANLAHGTRAAGIGPGTVFRLRAQVSPSPSRLGQRLTYRAWVLTDPDTRVTWAAPASEGVFEWGAPRRGRVSLQPTDSRFGYAHSDSVWLEIPLQVFTTGPVSVPGPTVSFNAGPPGTPSTAGRLPTVTFLVLPTIAERDSHATLRPLHGPLGAPWWEKVPWGLVLLAVFVLGSLVALIVWNRRRAPVPVAPPAPAAARAPALDASAEALAALAKLRERRLPEQGQVADHAFELTRILRRYLERTTGAPRPGDTSGELLARLRALQSGSVDLPRLEGLLGLWDRVKFARAPLEVIEAHRCEAAVEQLVRRDAPREVA